jgi:hypothetical protein
MYSTKLYLLPLILIFVYIPFSYGDNSDNNYIESVNTELYQELKKIKQCQLAKLTVSECKAKFNNKPKITATASKQEQPVNVTKVIPKNPNWWFTGAYDKTKPEKRWDHAVQANVSINEMSGNLDGSQHSASLNYFTRYNVWTNRLSLSYSKDDVKQNGYIASNREDKLFSISTRYDFNKKWFSQFGFVKEKDTNLSLENNDVYFLGLGSHILSSKELVLSGYVALGKQSESFSELNQVATGLDDYHYNVAVISEQLTWNITKNLSLKQSFDIFSSLDDLASFDTAEISAAANPDCIEMLSSSASYCVVKYEARNKIQLALGFEYKLNEYFHLSYSLNFKKNSLAFISDDATETSYVFGLIFNYQ